MDEIDENVISKNFGEKLENIEKRIDDINGFTKIALTVVGIVFVAFAIFSGVSLNQEKQSLESLRARTEEKIDKLLGLAKIQPELICTTIAGIPLQGRTIKATLTGSKCKFTYMMKNTGNGVTTNISTQVYSKDPLALADTKGSDEEGFDYIAASTYALTRKFTLYLPPGYAAIVNQEPTFYSKKDRAKGVHPILMKVYYGKEEPLKMEFYIQID